MWWKVDQDLLDDAKDPGADPVAAKAMKTFDLMDKVHGLNILWSLKIEMDKVQGFWSNSPSIDNMTCK